MERPILFSAPMVRAILEGRKTQTRRLVKERHFSPAFHARCAHVGVAAALAELSELPAPYGAPGDRLWVRETIRHVDSQPNPGPGPGREISVYAADNTITRADAWPWQRPVLPAIHCPRGLSRITLDVLRVRVERLRDISEEDSRAEGVEQCFGPDSPEEAACHAAGQEWKCGFADLWSTINGPESWDANPWVWVVEFRRATP